MGSYWSRPTPSGTTVTLEPSVKKVDTDAVREDAPLVSSEIQSDSKVTEMTSPITSDQVQVYIKGVETKKEPTHTPIKQMEEKVDSLHINNRLGEEHVVLLTQDELRQRILGMNRPLSTSVADETLKEEVKKNFKKAHSELLKKVECYENPKDDAKTVVNSEEDVTPNLRNELRNHVIRELENNANKISVKVTEKAVKEYLKQTTKEAIKSPSLEPVKEDLYEGHP